MNPASQTAGKAPSVHTAAAAFQKLCYDNKDALSAGIIVAGWDEAHGPSVYNIPLGGGLFRQPWAIGGMCRLPEQQRSKLTLLQVLGQHTSTVTVMPHTKKAGAAMKLSTSSRIASTISRFDIRLLIIVSIQLWRLQCRVMDPPGVSFACV